MKKILFLPFVLMTVLTAQAAVNHLRVEMLTGEELVYSLAHIGKIVWGEDDVLLYDKSGAQIGSTPFLQFGKIVFFEKVGDPMALNDVTDSSVQVFYDATGENLFVRGVEGLQTVRLYSATGQLLQSTNATNGEAIVPIGGLQNGAYLLQVGAQVVKFIKE